jgi:hypothetical protein
MKEKMEKIREIKIKIRDRRGTVLKKKVAKRLSIRRRKIENEGRRNKDEAEASWESPQGRE